MPFQKGQSGNPGGRRKATPISDMYRRIMADENRLKRYCLAQYRAAIKGDTAAAKEIADRLEGKPLQSMDINDHRRDHGANRLAELFEGAIKFNSSETGSGRTQ